VNARRHDFFAVKELVENVVELFVGMAGKKLLVALACWIVFVPVSFQVVQVDVGNVVFEA